MAVRRLCFITLVVTLLLPLASAQTPAPAASKHEPALDVTSMDRSVDPCVDFFKYSCGGWIKNNPIPPDQSSWDTYSKMQDENRSRLREILEGAAASDTARNTSAQKIGDYYASCTDEKAIESKGAEPLKPQLDRISRLTSKAEIPDVAAAMVDDNVLFGFGSTQDYRDASQVIAEADQGGLGLPDRDYYLKDDAKSVELRKAYVAHVQKMFELLGDQPDVDASLLDRLLELHEESGLAAAAVDFDGLLHPPVVLARSLWSDLDLLHGDVGCRQILRARPDEVARLASSTPRRHPVDIDTPEDFRRLVADQASSGSSVTA